MTYQPNPGQAPFNPGGTSATGGNAVPGNGTNASGAWSSGFVPLGSSTQQQPYTGYGQTGAAQYPPAQAPYPGTYAYPPAPENSGTGYASQYAQQPVPGTGEYAAGYASQQAPVPPAAGPAQKPARRFGLIHILVLAAILIGTGIYLFFVYGPKSEPFATAQLYKLTVNHPGDALIVRDETVYDADGITSVEYRCEEGQSVTINTAICDVYSSGFSTREMATLQEYRDQIRDYQINLLNSETTYDARMVSLESNVLNRALEVRQLISGAKGNLLNLEESLEQAIQSRQYKISEKYQADQRLKRLLGDEQAQLQRIDSWTTTFDAAREGIVSFYIDGYEYGLTPSSYATFTPQEVRRMIEGRKPDGNSVSKSKTAIFRIVQEGSWNVLLLMNELSADIKVNDTYSLQLEKFSENTYRAVVTDVVRLGRELLVRLSITDNVKPVLNVRVCTAYLQKDIDAFRVPKRAITPYQGDQGVVVEDYSGGLFVPVNVEMNEGDYCYVTPVQEGTLAAGMTLRLAN